MRTEASILVSPAEPRNTAWVGWISARIGRVRKSPVSFNETLSEIAKESLAWPVITGIKARPSGAAAAVEVGGIGRTRNASLVVAAAASDVTDPSRRGVEIIK